MGKQLSLRQVGPGGEQEVALLDSSRYFLGREPVLDESGNPLPESILLDNRGISRRHGCFMRVRNYWLYCDLGSTNGSCLNGVTLRRGQWRIVRHGDLLELADLALYLRDPEFKPPDDDDSEFTPEQRSVLVLSNGNFFSEFRVPMTGRILAAGGAPSDLRIAGVADGSICLHVESKNSSLYSVRGASDMPITVNGQSLSESLNLFDGDLIQIADYELLVNDPLSAPRKTDFAAGGSGDSQTRPGAKKAGLSQLTVFSKKDLERLEEDGTRRQTQVIFPAEFRDSDEPLRRDGPPHLMRQQITGPKAAPPVDFTDVENVVILIFTGLLLFGLLVMGIYFLIF